MYRPANLGGLGLDPEVIGRMPIDKLDWHWSRMRERQQAEVDGSRWNQPSTSEATE